MIRKLLIFFGLIIIILTDFYFYKKNISDIELKAAIEYLIQNNESSIDQSVSKEKNKKLPGPVKKYMEYSGVIDGSPVRFARLKQTGAIRLDDKKWTKFSAEQYLSGSGFLWLAKISPFGMISARDMYINGNGGMRIKLFNIYTIADAQGKEINISSLLRLITEMTLIPSSFVQDNVSWKNINSNSAKIFLKSEDLKVSGIFNFNDIGEIISFTTDERYMTKNEMNVKEKWTLKFSDYRDFNGFKIPTKAEAVWNLLSGDFSYIKIEINEIDYDNFKIY